MHNECINFINLLYYKRFEKCVVPSYVNCVFHCGIDLVHSYMHVTVMLHAQYD